VVDVPREMLEAMFQDMRERHRWAVDEPLVWGYFFIGHDPRRLEEVAALLVAGGYRAVEIFQHEKEDPGDADVWWLHVERVEHHTVDSLMARNDELNALAAENGLIAYDGMDAGPVGKH
jgi:hypothetical protein